MRSGDVIKTEFRAVEVNTVTRACFCDTDSSTKEQKAATVSTMAHAKETYTHHAINLCMNFVCVAELQYLPS
jgi:hypothetical protein